MRELSDAMMKKLREHSKQHKGGMNSKHIRNMKKFIKEGKSFAVAHKMAMALDKKPKKKY